MKKLSRFLIFVFVIGASLTIKPAAVHGKQEVIPENSLDAVCLPGRLIGQQAGCIQAGPSEVIDGLAQVGITFPSTPLPVHKIDPSLGVVPYSYAKLVNSPIPEYSQVPSAPGETPSAWIKGRLLYISYQGVNESPAGKFFLSRDGEWIDGSNIARATPPTFEGLEVISVPRSGFGWIMDTTTERPVPGYDAAATGKIYRRFDFVPVYETQNINNTDWTQIGPNEWVEKRFVARVMLNNTPPKGVENGRWIDINLYDQTITVYENNKLVFASLVSTGIDPFFTQPGLFKIYEKDERTTMSGSFEADRSDYYYLEDVPWTMYFDQARALHGAYWHSLFGYPKSHGCVNLSLADAHWLFNWASVGDWVYVHDPSNRTPTDPAYYTKGGA